VLADRREDVEAAMEFERPHITESWSYDGAYPQDWEISVREVEAGDAHYRIDAEGNWHEIVPAQGGDEGDD